MRFILLVFYSIWHRILNITQICDRLCHMTQKLIGMRLYAKKNLAGFPNGKFHIIQQDLSRRDPLTTAFYYNEFLGVWIFAM